MITIISPAKSVNFTDPAPVDLHTLPDMLGQSRKLIRILKQYQAAEISSLMSVSRKIAELNVQRYKAFKTPFDLQNAKQALFAFQGEVYRHMRIRTYDEDTLAFAQNSLRILSGLYGYLRPLDLIQAYRLEMKTRLQTPAGKDLYAFWGDGITRALNRDLKADPAPVLINLASREYAKAVDLKAIKTPVITIDFKEVENGKAAVISIFAKWARGLMADHIIRNQISDPYELQSFNLSDYRFSAGDSSAGNWVFTRPRPD